VTNQYDAAYRKPGYYWGTLPSKICFRILELMPPTRPLRLLDIGCGEGRNAVFFARNGYHITAFDLSQAGVDKTRRLAEKAGVEVRVFRANLLDFRLEEPFDILYASGVLHYIPPELRDEILGNYRAYTNSNGLNALNVFVRKPFIPRAPDAEDTAYPWISGELFTHYHDWKLEYCTEEIFDCTSSGVPHQHAIDRMIARKVG
jgi:tellurite methyltransferase